MLFEPFDEKGVPGTEAIVVSFDLEGFSQFFTQQDVHLYAPDYLNVIFDAVQAIFRDEKPYWFTNSDSVKWVSLKREPDFIKFTGDGAILIWTAWEVNEPISPTFKLNLMNNLWSLKARFSVVANRAKELVPLYDLPQRIRFGITRGTVYGLIRDGNVHPVDYVGFCINLAVRLQNYCRDLGFIASARLGIDDALVSQLAYSKVIAKNLKGFGKEIVYLDKYDYLNLQEDVKKELFI